MGNLVSRNYPCRCEVSLWCLEPSAHYSNHECDRQTDRQTDTFSDRTCRYSLCCLASNPTKVV